MPSLLPVALLAVFFGMRHATDPDHVVAVATIASRQRSAWSASGIGALWGLGHSATLLVVGATLVAFRLSVPPRLGLAMSAAVGAMLVSLGALAFRPSPQLAGAGGPARPGRRSAARPVLVGVVHGLDGSAAVTLAALASVRDARAAVLYLVVFGIGTLLGMTLITAAIAIPSVYAAARVGRLERGVRLAAGAVSVAYGGFLLYHAVVVGGLFDAAPRWSPA
jgi:high-affinity nickel-transport protein